MKLYGIIWTKNHERFGNLKSTSFQDRKIGERSAAGGEATLSNINLYLC